MRVVRRWRRVPREGVNAPSLAVFKATWDRALGNPVLCEAPLLVAGVWNWMILRSFPTQTIL